MANLTGIPSGFACDDVTRVYDPKTNTPKQVHPIGTLAYDQFGNEYRYIKAGAAIAQFNAVKASGATGFSSVIPTAAAGDVVLGVATAAFLSGEFGFILSRGQVTCMVVNATAAGSPLVTGATAGTLALATATDLAGQRPAMALVTGVSTGSLIYLG